MMTDHDRPRSYQVMNGIAVLPVSGTLVVGRESAAAVFGDDRLQRHIARLQQAASDLMVDGILLDMDTPCGMVVGHLTALTSSGRSCA